MSRLAGEQTELLRALTRHGVEFVVVGGVAAQVHGWRGATADLDIAVSTNDSNVERPEPRARERWRGTGNGRSLRDWPREAREHELADRVTVVVAAPNDILRSKEAACREKDRAALPQMCQDFLDADAR